MQGTPQQVIGRRRLAGHGRSAAMQSARLCRVTVPLLSRVASGLLATALLCVPGPGAATRRKVVQARLPVIEKVEFQPLQAQARRVAEALAFRGAPLAGAEASALDRATTVQQIQEVLDQYCLLAVTINPEQRVKVQPGPATAGLDENGWRAFLVKVANEAGTTAELRVESPNAGPVYRQSTGSPRPEARVNKADVPGRWLGAEMFNGPPLRKELSGLEVEYRLLELYCGDRSLGSTFSDRDRPAPSGSGTFRREAKIGFNVGQGTQDLGFRGETDLLFTCRPSVEVKFRVRDADGRPTMASFTIRDERGRVYPYPGKRLAPDFFFHSQVYRQDGESVELPPGSYRVESTRGPEYRVRSQMLTVAPGKSPEVAVRLERWIDPAARGWVSGDHHIHAAGCAHYENPTEGVFPEDMWRHILGEDLKVGCSLTWGPCYYYQKQFFTGATHKLSTDRYLLRYDIEVSGWSSHRAGHLCILRLTNQDYPGTKVQEDWPNLGLSVLKWAKAQGAVTGPAHSGWGLDVPTAELPNYIVPPYSGIGANEYIMQVTHEVPGPGGKLVPAVDFLSTVDTPYVWELNIWYHTLNAGFRTRVSGETDFPCIYGERVGLGRAYVKVKNPNKLDYDDWVYGIPAGRAYVSDGTSHLMDFRVQGVEVGSGKSEVALSAPGTIRATAKVAALLDETPRPEIRRRPYAEKPYWHLERARLGETREVPVELIVNGYPVARQNLLADGKLRDLTFEDVKIDRSSWVAIRILPSSHTNPVFVMVGEKPVRASRRSVEWCLKGVDACWEQKRRTYKPEEMETARAAYDHARQVYRARLMECETE